MFTGKWNLKIKTPMQTPFGVMVFDFALDVNGDELSGKAKMKMGSMTVTGVRARAQVYSKRGAAEQRLFFLAPYCPLCYTIR